MTRRDWLKSVAALAGASLVPTWLTCGRVIDLAPFCCEYPTRKFDMQAPFAQGNGVAYATDARICLQVPSDGDGLAQLGNHPPAIRLPWDHDGQRGWRPWPRQDHLLATRSVCPRCKGYGHLVLDAACVGPCPDCDGIGQGRLPGIQQLFPGHHIAAEYDAKIRRYLGAAEWRIRDADHPRPLYTPNEYIQFRFAGGLGLLMPLDEVAVKERLA